MRSSRDVAQLLDGRLGQLTLVGEQFLEDRFRQRAFELQSDELLAMPGDAAILRLEPGDAEPNPAVILDRMGALDAAAANRHIDHARLNAAAAPVAQGRRQAQRKALDAAAFGLIFRCLTHGTLTPAAFLLDQW